MLTEKKIYLIICGFVAIIISVVTIRHYLPGTMPEEPAAAGIVTSVSGSLTQVTYPPVISEHNTVTTLCGTSQESVYQQICTPAVATEPCNNTNSGLINLNTAGIEELTQLKGIGEKKAQCIIDYRENGNGFSCIEDIMNVKGIGEKTFENIKDKICI